jgi:hypothetical protein
MNGVVLNDGNWHLILVRKQDIMLTRLSFDLVIFLIIWEFISCMQRNPSMHGPSVSAVEFTLSDQMKFLRLVYHCYKSHYNKMYCWILTM